MPRRDGTGPMGMGPKSGRGMGSCSTGSNRGTGRRIGRGMGLALGLGLGLGLRRDFCKFWKNNEATDELSILKSQAEILEQDLEVIKEKIAELEQGN